jgi:hypothetical protein
MMRFKLSSAAFAAALFSILLVQETHAQEAARPLWDGMVEAGITGARPTGAFRDQVDGGIGFTLGARVPFGASGRFAARVDMSALTYGHESRQVCMRPGAGCRVEATEITSNDILTLVLGPELSLAGDPAQPNWVHPYLHGFAGFSIYATQSGLGSWGTTIPYFGFATTTNQRDAAFTWGGGGGVRFALPIQSRPVQLGISARFQRSGDVDYLREGDLVDLPDGSYRKELQRGKTDFVAFTIGGSIGFSFPWTSASDR